jgi:hypothetical protein
MGIFSHSRPLHKMNQTAKTTAEALFNNFIVHYGIPTKLHTYQGADFEIKPRLKITKSQ